MPQTPISGNIFILHPHERDHSQVFTGTPPPKFETASSGDTIIIVKHCWESEAGGGEKGGVGVIRSEAFHPRSFVTDSELVTTVT